MSATVQENTHIPSEVDKKKTGAKLDADLDREYLRTVLNTVEGRAVLWRILGDEFAGLFHTSFTGEDSHTNFNEGKRQIGIQLLAEIQNVNPNSFWLMSQEAVSRDTKRN